MRNVKHDLKSRSLNTPLSKEKIGLSSKKEICLDCGRKFIPSKECCKYPGGFLCLSCSDNQWHMDRYYDSAHYQEYGM